MGSRGAKSGASGGGLSKDKKAEIINDIKSHSSEDNDRAERNMRKWIERSKEVVDNKRIYEQQGHMESYNYHLSTYNSLTKELDFFRKERKRLGK